MKAACFHVLTLYWRNGRLHFDLMALLVFSAIFLLDSDPAFEPTGAAIAFFLVGFGFLMTLRQLQPEWLEAMEPVVTRKSGRSGAFWGTLAMLLGNLLVYGAVLMAWALSRSGFFMDVSVIGLIRWGGAFGIAMALTVAWAIHFSTVFSPERPMRRFAWQGLGLTLAALGLAGVRWPGSVETDLSVQVAQHLLPPLMPLIRSSVGLNGPVRTSGEILYASIYASALLCLARQRWQALDLGGRPAER